MALSGDWQSAPLNGALAFGVRSIWLWQKTAVPLAENLLPCSQQDSTTHTLH